jgi:hypothetical protein
MKIAVSYDAEGNILTLFDPQALRTDKGYFTYVPAKGEQHAILELPHDLEAAPLFELPHLLRVNPWGQLPRLERRPSPPSPAAASSSTPPAQPPSRAPAEAD